MAKKNKINAQNSIALDLIKAYKKQFYVVTGVLSLIIIMLSSYIILDEFYEKDSCFCEAQQCAVEVGKNEKNTK